MRLISGKELFYEMSFDSSLKALFLVYLMSCPYIFYPPPQETTGEIVQGYTEERFQRITEVFRNNFVAGLEREGASLAIYHKGEKVVHVWGGYANREENRKWMANTVTPIFSSTKAIASLVVAVLVDRGVLRYEDKVANYWPEYAANGKAHTTIEDVLTHKAGLPYLADEIISIEDVVSGQIFNKIANATPVWVPGDASGYHAITFGFIVDGIVRSVDPKRRNVAQFFKEEIADVHGIDTHIGLKTEAGNKDRIAKVTAAPFWEYVRDIIKDPRILIALGIIYRPDTTIRQIQMNMPWLQIDWDLVTVNDPSILGLELSAVTGTTSALELARLFSLSLNSQIISNLTLSQLAEPTLNSWHLERVTFWPVIKGHGFFYEPHPYIPSRFTFGHPGFGGQFIHVDPWTETVIAYVSNGLKTGTGELCHPYMNLFKETYSIIQTF